LTPSEETFKRIVAKIAHRVVAPIGWLLKRSHSYCLNYSELSCTRSIRRSSALSQPCLESSSCPDWEWRPCWWYHKVHLTKSSFAVCTTVVGKVRRHKHNGFIWFGIRLTWFSLKSLKLTRTSLEFRLNSAQCEYLILSIQARIWPIFRITNWKLATSFSGIRTSFSGIRTFPRTFPPNSM
jgi:hypothetical protein